MAAAPRIEDYDRVLIVEGYSDLHFYAEFFESLGKHGSVFIKHLNGKADLIVQLETLITPQLLAEKKLIGVIVDADANPAGTFTSFQTTLARLTNQNISLPGSWTAGTPKIGLFITPDANSRGELETLVWRAWAADPSNDRVRTCIESYLDCMKTAGHEARSPDKGLVSALLAVRNDEDPRLGPGARAKIFNLNRPEYNQLREFLSGF